MSAMPSESKTRFLLSSSASDSAEAVPPPPSAPNCVGSIGAADDAAGAGAWLGELRRRVALRDDVALRRRVALDPDELDVRAAHRAIGAGHRVGVVALERLELAALDRAVEEPDVAVGAEVVLAAPVVGDDVAGPGVLGADDLQVVLARLGVAHPGLDRGPAPARHLVPGLLQRPGDERRAPRVARRDLRRRQVLLDLLAAVGAADLLARPSASGRSAAPRCPSELPPPPAGATTAAAACDRRGAAATAGRFLISSCASASLAGSGRGTARPGARRRRSTRRTGSGRRSTCPRRRVAS